jgi:cytochrome c-type biogenesis protein CcsB
MTNQTLAQYANLSVYSAMVVFTLAMMAFALDLAGAAPRASSAAPRARRAAGIAMMLTRLGALLLVAAAAMRGLSVHRPPLGNMFEFALVGAMFVVVIFVAISVRRDVRWLGLFVTGPVLLTLGMAITVFYTDASELLPSLKSVWLVIHVTVATFAVALFTIAFSVTILHLVKSRLEAQAATDVAAMAPAMAPSASASASAPAMAPSTSSSTSSVPAARIKTILSAALPPAKSLDRTAYVLHAVAFPLWTFTLIAGAIWAEQAWGHYWNWDPKEVWTFVIWVLYAAYLHARATTGWSPRAANYLAMAGFGAILVNYMVVNVFFVGQHSYSGM